jgi:hypothetical protein
MARFDFVESTARAYQYSWANRHEILALAAPALTFKILSLLIALNFLSDLSILRQNLLIIPAYYFEGWVIIGIMARAVWPVGRSAEEEAGMRQYIQAGAIAYVLIKLMLSFIMGMTLAEQMNLDAGEQSPAPSGAMLLLLLAIIGFLIWSFRFLWLYVPLGLGYSAQSFLLVFKGFQSSFYMMGVWLLTLMPIGLILLMFSGVLNIIFPQTEGVPLTTPYINMLSIVQAFLDFVMSLVASLGMAFGIHSVMSGESRKPRR